LILVLLLGAVRTQVSERGGGGEGEGEVTAAVAATTFLKAVVAQAAAASCCCWQLDMFELLFHRLVRST
jgi:hypothetical protein